MDVLVVGEAVGFCIDAILFSICYKLYINYKAALTALKSAQVIEVGGNLEKLVKSLPDKKIPYVVIRGLVKAISVPVTSPNVPNVTGVIQKLTLKEHVLVKDFTGTWLNHERIIESFCNSVPFALQSTSDSTRVEVLDPLFASILHLETISDEYKSINNGLVDSLIGEFNGVIPKALQNIEEMLREGILLTGIGQISWEEGTIVLKLHPPTSGLPFYLTNSPVFSLLRSLENNALLYKILTMMFGGIGILLLFLLGKRGWKYYKEKKFEEELRKRRSAEARSERRKLTSERSSPDDQMCIVCRTNPREIILLPCGHVCICEDCNENIEDFCPFCRTRIETIAVVYYP